MILAILIDRPFANRRVHFTLFLVDSMISNLLKFLLSIIGKLTHLKSVIHFVWENIIGPAVSTHHDHPEQAILLLPY